MSQEEFLEDNIEEKDITTEKSKKILVILVILFLFAGTYYYYNNISKNKMDKLNNQEIAPITNYKKQPLQDKSSKETDISSQSLTEETKNTKEIVKTDNKIDLTRPIKPTDKAEMARLALIAAGKPDPFAGLGSRNQSRSVASSYSKFNSLPSPPSYIGGLPTIGDLPRLDIPQKQMPYGESPDSVTVKGFWGDKVIVNVNGVTESLKVNQSFQGIKVLKIDPGSLVAKFKKNGEIITKSIRNLNDLENNSDIKLVKDLNR